MGRNTLRQTSSVAGALRPRMSSELSASRSTALLSGIPSSSSLPPDISLQREIADSRHARHAKRGGEEKAQRTPF